MIAKVVKWLLLDEVCCKEGFFMVPGMLRYLSRGTFRFTRAFICSQVIVWILILSLDFINRRTTEKWEISNDETSRNGTLGWAKRYPRSLFLYSISFSNSFKSDGEVTTSPKAIRLSRSSRSRSNSARSWPLPRIVISPFLE